ncbi:molybdopterin-guanine dinucleotide biosynthesis protein B [Ectothiorhodospiraceae bacterium WFHF3C12]|nr:molybdopterin-guanine dinucleotide biosynthesis protein B [Ectothiorhodospiraceae bacterium WFHF3C12]
MQDKVTPTRGPEAPPYRALWPANARRPILGFAAYSGTGKTTLLRAVLPRLRAAGVRLALVKHAHHGFDIDHPGKDSYELRRAGADQVLVTSPRRRALMMERPAEVDPRLADELAYLHQDETDLILVEGFRHERFPKIELRRGARDDAMLADTDPTVIAVASDRPATTHPLPWLDINDPDAVSAFILGRVLNWQEET